MPRRAFALLTAVALGAAALPVQAHPAVLRADAPSQGVVAAHRPTVPRGEAAGTVADAVLVGAGDIASCDRSGDSKTAALVEDIAGTVFTTGDNTYDKGTLGEFETCYDPTWGAFRNRTRPSPGNHDYETVDAIGYFTYFGSAAGDPARGYYAYDLGAWRIYSLNSNCSEVGGCDAGSPQRAWLKADLAGNPRQCVLAYWHHPRFSSGEHGNNPRVKGLWTALYQAGADVIVNGHDHDYERFAKLRPNGDRASHGMREFVVGTGGAERRPFGRIKAHSQARNASTFGVIKLTLRATSYEWRFVPQAGKTFTDRGSTTCSG